MSEIYCMHLKRTDPQMRERLIDYCLNNQCLGFGWSFLYDPESENLQKYSLKYSIASYSDFYNAAYDYYKNYRKVKKFNSVFSCFGGLELNDLVWTRDTNGIYYLCRVLNTPTSKFIEDLDVGSVVKVEIQKVGTSVPGTIVHRFANSHSPTIQRIANSDERNHILTYSQSLFNQLTNKEIYSPPKMKFDLFKMLDGFELEELVLNYLQIKYNYYLSKNSVAKGDTTIKIEGELFPREEGALPSAVVQVKGRGNKNANHSFVLEYLPYVQEGKTVFLFFENQNYGEEIEGFHYINKTELEEFAFQYKAVLPPSLRQWIDLCKN